MRDAGRPYVSRMLPPKFNDWLFRSNAIVTLWYIEECRFLSGAKPGKILGEGSLRHVHHACNLRTLRTEWISILHFRSSLWLRLSDVPREGAVYEPPGPRNPRGRFQRLKSKTVCVAEGMT